MDIKRHAPAAGIALLVLTVVGMVLGAVGFAYESPLVMDIGEWLTVPATVVMGGALALAVVCALAHYLVIAP